MAWWDDEDQNPDIHYLDYSKRKILFEDRYSGFKRRRRRYVIVLGGQMCHYLQLFPDLYVCLKERASQQDQVPWVLKPR